jgi:hypothetical protein
MLQITSNGPHNWGVFSHFLFENSVTLQRQETLKIIKFSDLFLPFLINLYETQGDDMTCVYPDSLKSCRLIVSSGSQDYLSTTNAILSLLVWFGLG